MYNDIHHIIKKNILRKQALRDGNLVEFWQISLHQMYTAN